MKGFWIRRGLRFLGFALLFAGLAGLAVMTLWNALLPTILGVSTISFGQALGLLVLNRILFGGFGRGGWGGGYGRRGLGSRSYGRMAWKQKMAERWRQLTPEQRAQMKQQWQERYQRRGYGSRPQPEQPPQSDPTVV